MAKLKEGDIHRAWEAYNRGNQKHFFRTAREVLPSALEDLKEKDELLKRIGSLALNGSIAGTVQVKDSILEDIFWLVENHYEKEG